MDIRVLNPAQDGPKFMSLNGATRYVKKGRAIWSGPKAIKLICGARRVIPNRLPIQQSAATNKGQDTRGRFPILDAPVGVWTLRPVAV